MTLTMPSKYVQNDKRIHVKVVSARDRFSSDIV